MRPSKRIAPHRTADLSAAASFATVAFGIALAIAPTWARAETRVRGTPQAVVVEAQDASVEEILLALTHTFKVQIRSAANLDKRFTGTYEGTLQQAVSRILKGYDFVLKSGPAGLEITLIGSGKPVAVEGAGPATRPAEAAAAVQPQVAATEAGDRPVLVPSAGGPAPPIRVAQGQAPVPTPPATAAAPSLVPRLGPGPASSPTPLKPGAAPTSVPPLLAPPSPMPSIAAAPLASPISSAPVSSSSGMPPPVPSPTR
jgi:hypothetical protein